ncbi:MAG: imidazoleglycerol-phosphate dehydratase HisB [Candidatus Omnitrophica bacterium]|nr:imidazoleglycerol-phosphate dehydratase HisB [Candidatus Omnitrophota bacterium]
MNKTKKSPAAHKARRALVTRSTKETRIRGRLCLDGGGASRIRTGIPFLDHMLSLFAKHGLFDLELTARGDLEVDNHHTNEDSGIVIGELFKKALADKRGIRRYGTAFVPMDESLSKVRVVLDISGRPSLFFEPARVKMYFANSGYTVMDAREWLKAFSTHAGINLHVDILKGDEPHHILESIFKALGRSLAEAVHRDPRLKGLASTKGVL